MEAVTRTRVQSLMNFQNDIVLEELDHIFEIRRNWDHKLKFDHGLNFEAIDLNYNFFL